MSNTPNEKSSDKGSRLGIKIAVAAVAVLLLIAVMIIAEAATSRRYTIVNDTATDIESIVLYLENEDEDYYFRSENLVEMPVAADTKESGRFEEIEPYLSGASLMIQVKFVGKEEVVMYSGYFRAGFEGRIKIVFKDDKENPGNITADIRAGHGLFMSTGATDCDETQDLFLGE